MTPEHLLRSPVRSVSTWLLRLLSLLVLGLAFAGAAQAQLTLGNLSDEGTDPVPALGQIIYSGSISNGSATASNGLTLTFQLSPAQVIFDGAGNLASCSSQAQAPGLVVTCTGVSVPANGRLDYQIKVHLPVQGVVDVKASVSGLAASVTENTTINTGSDLALTITAPAQTQSGHTQNVVFNVVNNGPNDSPSSALTYSVPSGFSVDTLSLPTGCSLTDSTLTCAMGRIAAGANASRTVMGAFTQASPSALAHTADVNAAGGVADGVATNNFSRADTTITAGSKLTVTKSQSPSGPVTLGNSFNYGFDVRYSGDFPKNTQLVDPLPANFCVNQTSTSFTVGSWNCTTTSICPAAGGTLICTPKTNSGSAGSNLSLGSFNIPVMAKVVTASPVTNTATATATGADPASGSVTTSVVAGGMDLQVNKSFKGLQQVVAVGTRFTYTISATNLGPGIHTSSDKLTLVDYLPAGLQLERIEKPSNYKCTSDKGAFPAGDKFDVTPPQVGPTVTCVGNSTLAPGGSTLGINLLVSATTANAAITNRACVSTTNVPGDPVSANDCTEVAVPSQTGQDLADVEVRKRVVGPGTQGSPQEAGQPVTWEIEVINNGPATVYDMPVMDTFNNLITGSAATVTTVTKGLATMGNCSLARLTTSAVLSNCTIAALPPCTPSVNGVGGNCPRLQASVVHYSDDTASTVYTVTNLAGATAPRVADPNLDNNNATATAYFIRRTDLTVTKNGNPATVPIGQLLTYRIEAINKSTSPGAAYNVVITDTLPEGVVFLSVVPADKCSAPGPGSVISQAAGNRTLRCSWAVLPRNTSQTVTVTVRPLSTLGALLGGPGSITNTVTVASDTPEIQGGSADNSATLTTLIGNPAYDLFVNNVHGAEPVASGDIVTYSLTVGNNSASTAENVVLKETLSSDPGAPTYQGLEKPSGVDCDVNGVQKDRAGGTIVCTIATIGGRNGDFVTSEVQSVTVGVRVKADAAGKFTDTPEVSLKDSRLDALDTQRANNSNPKDTNVWMKSDVEVVSKTAVSSNSTSPLAALTAAQAAQGFDWLVQLHNNGPQDAKSVSFSDALANNMVLTGKPVFTVASGSFTPTAPVCSGVANGTSVSCAIELMPAGATATVRIPVRTTSPAGGTLLTNRATLVTTASVDANGGSDPNAGNNYKDGSIAVLTTGLSGFVYEDLNGNGLKDAGEPGIAAMLTLSGTEDGVGAITPVTVTSDPTTGAWLFSPRPGTYTVTQTQPTGYEPGITRVGSLSGTGNVGSVPTTGIGVSNGPNGSTANVIQGVLLGTDGVSINNLFGEVRRASLAGGVYLDLNNSRSRDTGDTALGDVAVTLGGTDFLGRAVTPATQRSAADGSFSFANLLPGTYTLTETQPSGYGDGAETAGTAGGSTAANDVIGGIALGSDATASGYLFGEQSQNATLSGFVYHDRNGNGLKDEGEEGIAGVTLTLSGTQSGTTTSDASGAWSFTVPAGTYTVTQTQPGAPFRPGITRAGPAGGGTVPGTGTGVESGPGGSTANLIQNITLAVGNTSAGHLFGEVKPATLAGAVYLDGNGNGQFDAASEGGLGDVSVTLSGTDFLGRTVAAATTKSAASTGSFSFAGLLPGTYKLVQTQPAGYADGAETAGSVGGSTAVNDQISGIVLASGAAVTGYHFGEQTLSAISGFVYHDLNGNGQKDADEGGIAGVALALSGSQSGTTTTDANGAWSFSVAPGTYTVTQTQPSGYLAGITRAGSVSGVSSTAGTVPTTGDGVSSGPNGSTANLIQTIVIGTGGGSTNNLFGEMTAITLKGKVYVDANGNRSLDSSEGGIAGVTVTLSGTDFLGNAVAAIGTTSAASTGDFSFTGLVPGTYKLVETQPAYPDGAETVGTAGGSTAVNDTISDIRLVSGKGDVTGYLFGELTNPTSTVSGRVWRDNDHDHRYDLGEEEPLSGWTVQLVACNDGSTSCGAAGYAIKASAVTGKDGTYSLTDVVPGKYQLLFFNTAGVMIGGVWPTDPTINPSTPTLDKQWIELSGELPSLVINQDLPLDPSGVLYDRATGAPLAGVTVELKGPAGKEFIPEIHLLEKQAVVKTDDKGMYKFFLMPSAPEGVYTLHITPPDGYVLSEQYRQAGPLSMLDCTAPNGVTVGRNDTALLCEVSPSTLATPNAFYFLTFYYPGAGRNAHGVVNNHVGLDPVPLTSTLIELRKTTPKVTVKKGEPVPYSITARYTGTAPLGSVTLVDTLPPGFKYLEGSLTVQTLPNGPVLPARAVVQGRQLRLENQSFVVGETKKLQMVLAVGVGVGEGAYVNSVVAQRGSSVISNTATAAVRVMPDALLDCTDVIGKVYDDRNANGWQDEGEPGLPNVRIATVNGLLVHTDADGRYHIACAAVPKDGMGSNLVLKLDERTLPSGYRVTTENPAAERITRGKAVKLNFGATVHRVVRLALQATAFDAEATTLKPEHAARLAQAVEALQARPSIVRLAYEAGADEDAALGQARVSAVREALLALWQSQARAQGRALFNLDVEVERVPASTTAPTRP